MYTERQPGQTDRSAIIAQMDKSCGNCELRIRPAKCDFYPVREAFEAVMRRGLCFEATYNGQQGIRSAKGFEPYQPAEF